MIEYQHYRLAFILPQRRQLLGLANLNSIELPLITIPKWQRPAEQLTRLIATKWKLDSIVLDVFADTPNSLPCAMIEVRTPTWDFSSDGFKAVHPDQVSNDHLSDEERQTIVSILAGKDDTRDPFSQLGWIDEAQEWIRDEVKDKDLRFTERFLQLGAGQRSALIRFGRGQGPDYWLKATGHRHSREFRVTTTLAALFPNHLPPLVAKHEAWSAWVMEDAGASLDDCFSLPALERAVIALAELQQRSLGYLDTLRDAGVVDSSIAVLQKDLGSLFEYLEEAMAIQTSHKVAPLMPKNLTDLNGVLHSACCMMEDLRIPCSLVHGDINLGNIVMNASHCAFIDWAEAGIGNPFLTFHQLLAHMVRVDPATEAWTARLEHLYKAQWRDRLTGSQIDRALTVAPLLTVLSCLHSGGSWLNSPRRNDPNVQGYARSLARRMDRVARAPELTEALCQ
jgi:hypothetical protein